MTFRQNRDFGTYDNDHLQDIYNNNICSSLSAEREYIKIDKKGRRREKRKKEGKRKERGERKDGERKASNQLSFQKH